VDGRVDERALAATQLLEDSEVLSHEPIQLFTSEPAEVRVALLRAKLLVLVCRGVKW